MRKIPHHVIWPLVAVAVALVLLLAVLVKPAGAHTGLLTASPNIGGTVGGSFTSYQLVFGEVVTEAVVWMENPQRERFEVDQRNDNGSIIEFEAPPITEDGIYIIRYTLVSADGDAIRSGYAFTYESSAPAPLPAAVSTLPQDDSNTAVRIATGVLAVSVAGLAGLFFWRSRELRHTKQLA